MTRERKSPRARAEEALGVAQRKVERLEATKGSYELSLRNIETELKAARERLEYVAANPDLPQPNENAAADTIDDEALTPA